MFNMTVDSFPGLRPFPKKHRHCQSNPYILPELQTGDVTEVVNSRTVDSLQLNLYFIMIRLVRALHTEVPISNGSCSCFTFPSFQGGSPSFTRQRPNPAPSTLRSPDGPGFIELLVRCLLSFISNRGASSGSGPRLLNTITGLLLNLFMSVRIHIGELKQ